MDALPAAAAAPAVVAAVVPVVLASLVREGPAQHALAPLGAGSGSRSSRALAAFFSHALAPASAAAAASAAAPLLESECESFPPPGVSNESDPQAYADWYFQRGPGRTALHAQQAHSGDGEYSAYGAYGAHAYAGAPSHPHAYDEQYAQYVQYAQLHAQAAYAYPPYALAPWQLQ